MGLGAVYSKAFIVVFGVFVYIHVCSFFTFTLNKILNVTFKNLIIIDTFIVPDRKKCWSVLLYVCAPPDGLSHPAALQGCHKCPGSQDV